MNMVLETKHFLSNIELKRNIKIPICFIELYSFKKLNNYIDIKIYIWNKFYKNYKKNIILK